MNLIEDKLKKLGVLITKFTSNQPKTKFVEATLESGEVIKIEGEVAVGAMVYILTEEGELSAPDGDYKIKIEDKTHTLKVEGGKIAEIKPEEAASEFNAQDKYNEVIKRIEELSLQISTLNKENTQFKAVSKEIFEVTKAITELPAAKPTEVSTKKTKLPDTMDKFRAMAEQLSK